MVNSLESPRLMKGGVMFTVVVDYQSHDCLVSRQTLCDLCRSAGKKIDLLDAYGAYEARIKGVARRLIAAGITGSPILFRSAVRSKTALASSAFT